MYKLIKLSKIAKVSTGFPFKGEQYSNEGIRVVRGENVTVGSLRWDNIKCWNQEFDQAKKYSLQDGDVVIGMDGSKVGKNRARIKKTDLPLLLAQRVALIRNTELSNQNFLYYLIRANRFEEYVERIQTGSSVPHISQKQIEEYEVPDIAVEEQKKISDVLIALDSKIELNNRINSELEAMAKTLYDYWFVQFDFPDNNGKPYKASGGKMVWDDNLKKEIPKGWKAQKMAEWIDIDKSGDWGKENAEGNFSKKVICFRGADINGLNGLDELKPPVRYILEKNSFKILKSHDLIIEISGGSPTQSTGRLAFITDATIKRFEHPLICSNFCKPVSMRNKKLLYNFVYYWKSLYDNGIFFGYEGKTSGIKNLLLDSFISSYYTVVPEEKIVDQFYDIMDDIQEKKQTVLSENQKLFELRDWLLPMLMNGQVTVA